jgi:Na+-translocating ferredoxin:NAD+ oxidoreductase RNF subunit RnfB
MPSPAVILKRFASSRIRALQAVNRCDVGRFQAASKIRNVAEYFKEKPDHVQIRAVRQIESEIRLLLPSEESRYKKQREQMLQLIEQATNPD